MRLNHVLIRTQNIDIMTQFFVNIIGLEVGFRPPFPFVGVWLYGQSSHLIHLVAIDESDQEQMEYLGRNTATGNGIVDHIAFHGGNYGDLLSRLVAYGADYTKRSVPLTKERQVFVTGPEQLVIELVFPQ